MVKNKIFLDTSILITALLSSLGGSFYILNQLKDKFHFQIDKYVLEETLEVLSEKFPSRKELKSNLFFLIGFSKIEILSNSPKELLNSLNRIINQEDAPILASALENSDYLLTLDKKDFLNNKVKNFAKQKDLLILTPRQFIESLQG